MSKRECRREARRRRLRRAPHERVRLGQALADHALSALAASGARTVLCYVAVRRELPTQHLLQAMLDEGYRVCVPFCVDDQTMRARRLTALAELHPGPFGIPTSTGEAVHGIDVCLCPGLAFTRRGARLGYGGGFYDRFLSTNRQVDPWGVGFDDAIVEHLPTNAHDVPMRRILTPSSLFDVLPHPA